MKELDYGKTSEEEFEGTVSKWFTEKGYGFISLADKEYFVHITKTANREALQPGTKVKFRKIRTMKGVQACSVEQI